jgi:hypothetical protein
LEDLRRRPVNHPFDPRKEPMAAKKKTTTANPQKHTAAPTPAAVKRSDVAAKAEAIPVVPPVEAPDTSMFEQPAAHATVAAAADRPAAPAADVRHLIAGLGDPSAEAACDAAAALGLAGDRSAVAALAAVVENADGYYHGVVRAAAAASLGQLRDPAALPALVAGIRDPMAEASAEAVRALAALGDARAVEPLVAAVRNADGFLLPVVRRAAVLALVHLGGPNAIAALRAVANDPYEDPSVRQAAIGEAAARAAA